MDWNKLWNNKMSNITYAGVRLTACRNCGDFDQNCCDCAKVRWIKRRADKLAVDSNYLCKQDTRYWERINNPKVNNLTIEVAETLEVEKEEDDESDEEVREKFVTEMTKWMRQQSQ